MSRQHVEQAIDSAKCGKIGNHKVRYVICNCVESMPCDYCSICRKCGGTIRSISISDDWCKAYMEN